MSKEKDKKAIHNPDDTFFKKVMSDATNARAYLTSFYPELLVNLDLGTLELDQTSYVNAQLKNFHSDIVYRCQFKGSEKGIYFSLLWEHKSQPDNGVVLQIGLYIFTALYKMYHDPEKELEPILPLIFYNGKQDWEPKTIRDLFEAHPFFEQFERYLPRFDFNFLNITKRPLAELLQLKVRFFRAAMLSMANRHKADFLLENIVLLFDEQSDHQAKILAHYFVGIIERSPKEIQKSFKNIEFTTKATIMSTLELLREEGRVEGRELERKRSIFKDIRTLFNVLKEFPNLENEKIAIITLLEVKVIEKVKQLLEMEEREKIKAELANLFFEDFTLSVEEAEQLQEIIAAHFQVE